MTLYWNQDLGFSSLHPSFKYVTPHVGTGPRPICSRLPWLVAGAGGAAGGGGERPAEASAGESDH